MRKQIPILGSAIKIATFAYIYIRVSSDEQARDMHCLETKLSTCEDFCAARGWLVKGVFRDAGDAAWEDIMRPGFKDAMDALKKDRDANLVFYDYLRFGRKTLPALIAFDKLDQLGIYAIAVTDPNIDGRTSDGRSARFLAISRAEDFCCNFSDDQKLRMKLAVEGGTWCTRPPLGYDLALRRSKGEPNIVPFEKEAVYVRKSFSLIRDGKLLPVEALRKMTELGLRSKGGKKLTVGTFVKMLRNPVYIGKVASKHGVSKGLHVGLIPAEMFEDVQATLDGTRKPPTPTQRNRESFPLRRFLRCTCGSPFTGYSAKSRTGRVYNYYFCRKCYAMKPVRGAEEGE